MSNIFDWFRRKLGIETGPHTQYIDLPQEFQLSNKSDEDYIGNDGINNFVHTNHLSSNLNENMNMTFISNLEKLFDQMGFDFEISNCDEDNSNIFNVLNNVEDGNFDQSTVGTQFNKIPKRNYIARDYFLNSGLTSRKTWIDSPVRVEISPHFTSQTSSSKSYYSSQWNGKKIEKEVSTKQLPDGTTQTVTVMKDSNKKLITTVDMLSGRQLNCKKELYNLDESQLDEFEKRFSKF